MAARLKRCRSRRDAILTLGGVAAAGLLAGCDKLEALRGGSTGAFHALDITGSDHAGPQDKRAFRLRDPQGQERQLSDYAGKLVVVFFGYTQCPDVCPTTMAALAEAKKMLGADAGRVQGIFITVDPQRDTPELLAAYTAQFGPDLVGLRGDEAQLAAAAKSFKVYWSIVPGKTPTSYSVDHSAGSTVFDTRGRLRLYFRHGMPPQQMADDFKRLLAEKD